MNSSTALLSPAAPAPAADADAAAPDPDPDPDPEPDPPGMKLTEAQLLPVATWVIMGGGGVPTSTPREAGPVSVPSHRASALAPAPFRATSTTR